MPNNIALRRNQNKHKHTRYVSRIGEPARETAIRYLSNGSVRFSIKSIIALSRQVLADSKSIRVRRTRKEALVFTLIDTLHPHVLSSLSSLSPFFICVCWRNCGSIVRRTRVDQSGCSGMQLLSGYLFTERRTCVVRTGSVCRYVHSISHDKTPRRGVAVPRREDTPSPPNPPPRFLLLYITSMEIHLFILNNLYIEKDGRRISSAANPYPVRRITRILCVMFHQRGLYT